MQGETRTRLIVFTAPSGAGKTTIVRHLIKEFSALSFSVSATNRPAREHEVDGRDYHFLSTEAFLEKVHNKEFLEWEEVYEGQYYGTLKSEVADILDTGKHVIFDIDVRGATAIKSFYGDQCMVVFIRPPSFTTLVKRLKARATDTDASLERRIARMKEEMTYEDKFDRILINDLLAVALQEAELMVEEFLGIKSVTEEE
ncbi:MAG: guanylate kinase [Saprospiraceae bacterium]|nr:guanylate kinase [Saprospiraceae bacterium]